MLVKSFFLGGGGGGGGWQGRGRASNFWQDEKFKKSLSVINVANFFASYLYFWL